MNDTMLFVDDDLNLLQGLQRMLRSKRSEWDMVFVSSAQEGLDQMEKRCFDVVVTDMRMPDIDGAEFLARVKKKCPKSVRIILSGQAELDTIVRAIGSTHQYLSKPCDPEMLKATIDRASRLRRSMKNELLSEFISRLEYLPSQPALYDRILIELRANQPDIEALGTVIARDLGMAVKVLQLVNSSFFGPKREVTSIHEAVGLLGVDLLRQLILKHRIFFRAEENSVSDLKLDELNKHSVSVGNFALRIAVLEGLTSSDAETCVTVGLLCDVGKIILSLYAPQEYNKVLAIDNDEDRLAKEIELFGATHSEAGAYLLGLWGMPDTVVNASSLHSPSYVAGLEEFPIVNVLQIANYLAHYTNCAGGERLKASRELDSYRKLLENVKIPSPVS